MLNLALSLHILSYLLGSAEPQSSVLSTMWAKFLYVALEIHMEGRERQ